jgi:hypothetical protein
MVTQPRPRASGPRPASAAAYTFRMITSYAGIPSSFDLSRTVQTRMAPVLPKNS